MYTHYLFIEESEHNEEILNKAGLSMDDFSCEALCEIDIPHILKVGDIIRIDEVLRNYTNKDTISKARVISSEISICQEFVDSEAFITIDIELEII